MVAESQPAQVLTGADLDCDQQVNRANLVGPHDDWVLSRHQLDAVKQAERRNETAQNFDARGRVGERTEEALVQSDPFVALSGDGDHGPTLIGTLVVNLRDVSVEGSGSGTIGVGRPGVHLEIEG